jgi:hypothetical protein
MQSWPAVSIHAGATRYLKRIQLRRQRVAPLRAQASFDGPRSSEPAAVFSGGASHILRCGLRSPPL